MSGHERELSGIGGWLVLFLACLAFAAFAMAMRLYGDLRVFLSVPRVMIDGFDLKLLAGVRAAFYLLELILCGFLAWRLISVRNRRTVAIVIAGLWLVVVLGPLFGILTSPLSWGIDHFGRDLLIGTAKDIAACIPWTAYFLRSRRVANTYGRRGRDEAVAEIFG